MCFWLLASFLATRRRVHFNKRKQQVEYTFLPIIVMHQSVATLTNRGLSRQSHLLFIISSVNIYFHGYLFHTLFNNNQRIFFALVSTIRHSPSINLNFDSALNSCLIVPDGLVS